MKAQEIVDSIGSGVKEALKTNQLFLGVEEDQFKNADIHPEYVTTVKVGEALTGPDRVVSLETRMKLLKQQAALFARISTSNNDERKDTLKRLRQYTFGKKDTQRLDILVRPSGPESPPYLLAEAKLGAKNLPGVLKDITRIAYLLAMYKDVGILKKKEIYGAVVFHLMQEGSDSKELRDRAKSFLNGISAHLENLSSQHPWVKVKHGLLTSCEVAKGISGYQEYYDDGTVEDVFAKDRFAFMPGLVLLGNAEDVSKARF